MRSFVLAGLGAVLLLAAGVAWLALREPPGPSLLLITLDTTRADRLGPYGYARPTTPHLDRLAEGAAVFEQAYTPATTSGPAHASMLTGLRPDAHGIRHNGDPLLEDVETIASRLRDAGYRTAAFVSHGLVGKKIGLDRGFETFVLKQDKNHVHKAPRTDRARRVFAAAARFIRKHPNRFFVWVHAQHPHFDYRPPLEFERRFLEGAPDERLPYDCAFEVQKALRKGVTIPEDARKRIEARYDGEIALVDSGIGVLLDAVREAGAEARTTVVVTADHGETLFDRTDHALFGHGYKYFEEVVRVPLLLRGPNVAPGRKRGYVETTQIAETLAEIAGLASSPGGADVPAPEGNPNVRAPPQERAPSLMTAVRSGRGAHEFPVLTWPSKDRKAIRAGRWKLMIHGDERLLFDLDTDPTERHDVAALHPQEIAQLEQQLAQLDGARPEAAGRTTDPEVLEMLREGGYLDAPEDRDAER